MNLPPIPEKLPKRSVKVWLRAMGSLMFFLSSSQIFTLLLLLPPPPRRKQRRRLYKLLLWWYADVVVRTHANIRTRIINETGEAFIKPGIMIANHQSIFDVPATMMLSPKILIVSKDWAHQPMFHFLVGKYIDIFSVNRGLENYVDEFRQWIEKGYLILIFPEGIRWETGNIERFHKGAFYLAEKLQVDILPILLHGDGTINSRRYFYFKKGFFYVKVMPRIKPDDYTLGTTYQEKTKNVRAMYISEYAKLGTPSNPEAFH